MSTYNDIEVGKVISTLKVIIDRVYVIGDGAAVLYARRLRPVPMQ